MSGNRAAFSLNPFFSTAGMQEVEQKKLFRLRVREPD